MKISTKLFILSVLLGIAAIYIMLTKVSFAEVITAFKSMPLPLILGYVVLSLGVWFAHGIRWMVIMRNHNINIAWYRVFFYRMFGNSVSYLTPSARIGGEFVRMAMLKRHNYSTKHNLSTIIIDKTLELATNGVFFCIGILIMLFTVQVPANAFFTMLIIGIIFALMIFFYYYHMLRGKSLLPKLCKFFGLLKIRKINDAMHKIISLENIMVNFYKENTRTFLKTVALSAFAWGLMIVEFYALLNMVGLQPKFFEIFLVFSFVGLAYVVPLPMAIGSLEGSMLWIFAILGWPAGAALAVALIIRLRDTILAVVGLGGLSAYGFKLGKLYDD